MTQEHLCEIITFRIIIFIVLFLLFTVNLVLTILVIYQFICKHDPDVNDTPIAKRVKYFCVFTQIQCIFTQISFGGIIYYVEEMCPDPKELSTKASLAGYIATQLYTVSLTLLYLVFVGRVHITFSGSMYELSKKTSKLLFIVFCFQLFCNISVGFSILNGNTPVGLLFMALSVVKCYVILISRPTWNCTMFANCLYNLCLCYGLYLCIYNA